MSGIALSTIEWLRAGAPLRIPGSGWPVLSDPPDPTPQRMDHCRVEGVDVLLN